VFSRAVFKEDLPGAEAFSVDVVAFSALFASTLDALIADRAPFRADVLFSAVRISARERDALTTAATGLRDTAVAGRAVGTTLGSAFHLELAFLVRSSRAHAGGAGVGLLAVFLAGLDAFSVDLAVVFGFANPVDVSAGGAANAGQRGVDSVFTFSVALFKRALGDTRAGVVITAASGVVRSVGSHAHTARAGAVGDLSIVGFASLGRALNTLVGRAFALKVRAAAVRLKDLTFVSAASGGRFRVLLSRFAGDRAALADLFVDRRAAVASSSVEDLGSGNFDVAVGAVEDLVVFPALVGVAVASLDRAAGGLGGGFLLPSEVAAGRGVAEVLVADTFSVGAAASHSVT